jgi:hypothetical protein
MLYIIPVIGHYLDSTPVTLFPLMPAAVLGNVPPDIAEFDCSNAHSIARLARTRRGRREEQFQSA